MSNHSYKYMVTGWWKLVLSAELSASDGSPVGFRSPSRVDVALQLRWRVLMPGEATMPGAVSSPSPSEFWTAKKRAHPTHWFLVGGWATPLKNMTSSIGMMTIPNIHGKIKFMATSHHQAVFEWVATSEALFHVVFQSTEWSLSPIDFAFQCALHYLTLGWTLQRIMLGYHWYNTSI